MSISSIVKVSVAVCIYAAAFSSFSAEQAYGDWFVTYADDKSGDTITATFSDGTSTAFAIRCFAKDNRCLHLVRLGSLCEDGSTYPVLINAPTGAAAVTGVCSINDGVPEMLLTPFDDVRSALNGSGMLGVAVPMASGAFKAVRFSLKGSSQAIKAGEEMLIRNPRSAVTDTKKRGMVTF